MSSTSGLRLPCVAATWSFGEIAVSRSAQVLRQGGNAIDAVEQGIREVELDNRDQYFVGVGGFPNAEGDMELDAAIMDHRKRYGAVMALKNTKNPISVARTVMEKCVHNVLVGEGAEKWARSHGFPSEPDVLTEESRREWMQWKDGQDESKEKPHDTIGLICLDREGRLCAGTSTSGWKFKHPGRVGDAPLVGSGIYCDGNVGAAVATGDGEEIMRNCLSFLIVESMRNGVSVRESCRMAIERMSELDFSLSTDQCDSKPTQELRFHQKLTVAVVAMDKHGNVGAASTLDANNCHREKPFFPAMVWKPQTNDENVEIANDIRTLQASFDGDGC